jgi:hypothetical protein
MLRNTDQTASQSRQPAQFAGRAFAWCREASRSGRPLDQFDRDLVGRAQVGDANARIRSSRPVDVRRRDRDSAERGKVRDDGFDVTDIEGDMRKPDIAGPCVHGDPIGGSAVLDQFDGVVGPVEIGDLDFGAINSGYRSDGCRVAPGPRRQGEAQPVLEEGDRPAEVGDREARMVGRGYRVLHVHPPFQNA